jgi:RNA polymerase sigma-70 factor (ECF subfamily)
MPELQDEMMELPEMLEDREEIRTRADCLSRALAKMTTEERNVLIRRYFYFEDIADLARSQGVARAAMDNRLSRARRQLRKFYSEAQDGAIHE